MGCRSLWIGRWPSGRRRGRVSPLLRLADDKLDHRRASTGGNAFQSNELDQAARSVTAHENESGDESPHAKVVGPLKKMSSAPARMLPGRRPTPMPAIIR